MRAATFSLRLKLLVLLLGLVLFVLCRPADGAKTSKASGGSTTVASSGKAKRAATVKKSQTHKKTRKKTTRRAHSPKTRKSKSKTKATTKARGPRAEKSAKAETSKTTGGAGRPSTAVTGKTSAQPPHRSSSQTGKAATGKSAREPAPARPIILSSPVRSDNATDPAPGTRWTEPRTGMVFRWIPSGCFVMGSPKTEHGRERDEGPQHKVCLSGFWMGETEVTQGQWTAIMDVNPSLIKNGEDQPVDMVSWKMAREYAKTLGQGSVDSYRLPTEAEWEYACRAGTDTPYFFGEEATKDQATFDKPFVLPLQPLSPGGTRRRHGRAPFRKPAAPKIWPNMHTTVVGSYPANAFGLFDMHGNLWEWCEDVYDAGFYARSPRDNPLRLGEGRSRVIRGGSWVTRAESLRSANRGHGWPDMRTAFYGLRLVRMAGPETREVPQPQTKAEAPAASGKNVSTVAPAESSVRPLGADKATPAASGPDKPRPEHLPVD